MSIKYTPGPWFVKTYADHKPDADRGDWCGEIYSTSGKVYYGPFSFDALPKEADARLIAYAPNLFEMLETMCDGLEWNIDNHILMNESDSETLASARALIAKIKGEQP